MPHAAFIADAHLVMERFGSWPRFHDAEVLRVEMARSPRPTLRLELFGFTMSGQTDEQGFYKRLNPNIITLRFEGIRDLRLEDFNHQNVISSLSVSSVPAVEFQTQGSIMGMEEPYGASRDPVLQAHQGPFLHRLREVLQGHT